jgi:hypothetical protein
MDCKLRFEFIVCLILKGAVNERFFVAIFALFKISVFVLSH